MEIVYILSGSNRGDRRKQLEQAQSMVISEAGQLIASSGIYESLPWGFKDEITFYNQVFAIETSLGPETLLDKLLTIEARLGRIRFTGGCGDIGCSLPDEGKTFQSRTIDLDILFFGQRMVFTDSLMVPHPRLHERRFALAPLNEIAADFMHPLLKKSVSRLLQECTDTSEVKLI